MLLRSMSPAAARHHVSQKARRLVHDTWEAQANLSFFLTLLVLFTFVFPLANIVEQHFSAYVEIAYSLMLISGMAIAWGRSLLFYPGVVVGVAGLITRWGGRWYAPLTALRDPVTLAAIMLLVIILLVRVFERGPISGSRIQGAIAAYLLLGMGWAHAYAILSRLHPHAFTSTGTPLDTMAAWTYFSFATLTTVGYGDIVPSGPAARMVAMGEALAGQLYLTVLIARLVALQVSGGGGNGAESE
jgi:Ion channel